jgi:hypothetical protein
MSVFSPLQSIVVRPSRRIGEFQATVTIDENAQDDLEITSHPVQRGAAISDHAYLKPSTLSIKCIFAPFFTPLSEVYEKFLSLQASREPFDVVTGKRIYKNMLLKSVSQTTDKDSELVLSVDVSLQQVIIVDVQLTTVPPRAKQKSPAKTGATTKVGEKKAVDVTTKNEKPRKKSALSGIIR